MAAGDAGSLDGARPDATAKDGGGPDGAGGAAPNLRDDGKPPPWRWDEMAARVMDSTRLQSALSANGNAPPAGTEIYAARVDENALGHGYAFYDYGAGAFSQAFWPASTIKLLSSLAALDWVKSQGFTGAATVKWQSGFSDVIHNIVRRAIQKSSNEDYDRTVRIAGFDQLNAVWLSPERGFPTTVIKSSYAGFEVKNPPGYTLSEAGNSKMIPARAATGSYPCKSGGNSCANLFELTEAVRRVVWHDQLPSQERFDLPAADRAVLVDALCTATPSFFETGVQAALGSGARICHKPGWVPSNDSLDHGVIEAADGRKFLLAAAVPDPGDSSSQAKLAGIAEHSLAALSGASGQTFYLQRDAGAAIVVQADSSQLSIFSAGADEMEVYFDGTPSAASLQPDGVFQVQASPGDYAGKLVSLRALKGSTLIAVRNVVLGS